MVAVTIWRLRPLTFLPASYPRGPPLSVVLTDWLSMIPAEGLASRPAASRGSINNSKLIRIQDAVVAPRIEIVLHVGKRRKLSRQQPPLTTRPGHVEQRIDDASHCRFRRAPKPLAPRQMGWHHQALIICEIRSKPQTLRPL